MRLCLVTGAIQSAKVRAVEGGGKEANKLAIRGLSSNAALSRLHGCISRVSFELDVLSGDLCGIRNGFGSVLQK